MYENAHQNVN